jgi:hypothetical protein
MNGIQRMVRPWQLAAVMGAAFGTVVADAATTVSPAADAMASLATEQEADPLPQIRHMMGIAHQQLADYQFGPEQVNLQQQIVRRLEELLGEGGGQSSGSQASGAAGAGGNTRPPAAPSDRSSAGSMPDEARPAADAARDAQGVVPRLWGKLPPEAQRQLESAFPQRFLPAYEEQIRAYYRRLVEEQGLGGP